MPRTKSFRSGTCASTLLPSDQVGLAARGDKLGRSLGAEELHQRGHALLLGRRGDVRRRLDAEHRHALRDEVLQQVAVVARDLDHEARCAEAEARRPSPRRRPWRARATSPSTRRNRRSRVKISLRRLELLELHQEALLAHPGVQRIEALHAVRDPRPRGKSSRAATCPGRRRTAERRRRRIGRRRASSAGELHVARNLRERRMPARQRPAPEPGTTRRSIRAPPQAAAADASPGACAPSSCRACRKCASCGCSFRHPSPSAPAAPTAASRCDTMVSTGTASARRRDRNSSLRRTRRLLRTAARRAGDIRQVARARAATAASPWDCASARLRQPRRRAPCPERCDRRPSRHRRSRCPRGPKQAPGRLRRTTRGTPRLTSSAQPLLLQLAKLGGGQHQMHARHRASPGHVDRSDPRVRVRGAEAGGVEHSAGLDVVDEGSEPTEEPRILVSRDARTD